jgi:hypothetical protein
VENVIKSAGGDKAAFEIMISAAAGAGLYRWNTATKILKETVTANQPLTFKLSLKYIMNTCRLNQTSTL